MGITLLAANRTTVQKKRASTHEREVKPGSSNHQVFFESALKFPRMTSQKVMCDKSSGKSG